ncbi:hypothetical protein CEXT_59131 [Caerostris extrusa]|uniref:Uncharacterized protein n=1 Tax=Caerostris extrusa TaxID=172846 RepID=A0AAV4U5R3_CAEEX|nr:hypothetical protein CEXT_59131 [Caerostris extrusa]
MHSCNKKVALKPSSALIPKVPRVRNCWSESKFVSSDCTHIIEGKHVLARERYNSLLRFAAAHTANSPARSSRNEIMSTI